MIQRCRLKPSAYIHSSGCSSARCVSTRSGRFRAPKSNQLRAQEVVTLPWGGVRTRNNFGTSSSSLLRQTLSHHLDNQLSMKFSTFTKSEYIHPLSQIVLEHLQSHHSLWVTRMGLDTGLQLNKDGTFALRFPPSLDDAIKTSVIGNDEESSPGAIYGCIW